MRIDGRKTDKQTDIATGTALSPLSTGGGGFKIDQVTSVMSTWNTDVKRCAAKEKELRNIMLRK